MKTILSVIKWSAILFAMWNGFMLTSTSQHQLAEITMVAISIGMIYLFIEAGAQREIRRAALEKALSSKSSETQA